MTDSVAGFANRVPRNSSQYLITTSASVTDEVMFYVILPIGDWTQGGNESP